jgi:hypothetical protein
MTGCGDCFNAPSIAGHDVAINKLAIGLEFAVTTGIKTRRFVEMELSRRAMRPFTVGWRARRGFDARCGG